MAVKHTTASSSASSQRPSKRPRTSLTEAGSSTKGTKQTLQAIKSLEEGLSSALSSSSSLNALVDIQSIATSASDPEVVSKAIYALYRLYTQIATKGLLEKSKGGDGNNDQDVEEKNIVRSWLLSNINSFGDFLIVLLKDRESHLRTSSLQILFAILKLLSSHTSSNTQQDDATNPPSTTFDGPFFHKIVFALLSCPPPSRDSTSSRDTQGGQECSNGYIDTDVCDVLLRTWLNKHADVRWYFMREVIIILSTPALLSSHPKIPANALSVLEKLEDIPSKDGDIKSFWLEGFASSTFKSHKSDMKSEDDDGDDNDDEDDWRTFFDDPVPSSSTRQSQTKRKRLHKMSVMEQIHSFASHRAVFTHCWVTLLPLLSSLQSGVGRDDRSKRKGKDRDKNEETPIVDAASLTTRALTVMHRGVMPHLTKPVLVMDWVAGCVDQGGVVGMLALNALFILMKDYNLDYPQFYTRLYAFLDRDLLHAKYRARFFRLLELFLSSSHLPATLLASFIKRLSQLSLPAPPAAIVLIIPFTYNILKRHPALMVMIHNPDFSTTGEYQDPFLPTASNPTHTNALQSSLWELYTHTKHYHHAVSVLARIFESTFTKNSYRMEDFLDHSYASLFDTESSRKIKPNVTVPVLEPEVARLRKMVVRTNAGVGSEVDVEDSGIDYVSSLWTF